VTAAELIAALEAYPGDAEVHVLEPDGYMDWRLGDIAKVCHTGDVRAYCCYNVDAPYNDPCLIPE
jgi:hypothetical protein